MLYTELFLTLVAGFKPFTQSPIDLFAIILTWSFFWCCC